jgi:hypothetical protein
MSRRSAKHRHNFCNSDNVWHLMHDTSSMSSPWEKAQPIQALDSGALAQCHSMSGHFV